MKAQILDFAQKTKGLDVFLIGYLISMPFISILDLPLLGRKFQLPEVVFLIGIVHVIINNKKIFHFKRVDWTLLSLPIVFGVSAIFYLQLTPLLEALGLVYLFFVYRLFFLSVNSQEQCFYLLGSALNVLSVIMLLITFSVAILSYTGLLESEYLFERKWIPIVGWVIRISGFSPTPNMWLAILVFTISLQLGIWLEKGKTVLRKGLLYGLTVACILTLSKSLVTLLGIYLIFFSRRSWVKFSGVGLILIYLFLCHWLVLPDDKTSDSVTYFISSKCQDWGGMKVCPTTYLRLKEVAIQAFIYSKGLGVGGGQFIDFVKMQQRTGQYSIEIPVYEPHSTYTGMLGEVGIPGVLVMGGLLYYFFSILKNKNHIRGICLGAIAYIVFLIVEACVMDILNFRMLWVTIGLWAGWSEKPQENVS
jgi:hypothetical protein